MKKIIIYLSFTAYLFSGTFEKVIKNDVLVCGVNKGLAGFSKFTNNKWQGIDVDYCKSVAAVVLGDSNKVKYIPLTAKERFSALINDEIDILSRNTTWTYSRDISMGVNFIGVLYYDGQGFMIPKELNITSAINLNNVRICFEEGTTIEKNLKKYFSKHKLEFIPVPHKTNQEVNNAFFSGHCDVLTSDKSGLYSARSQVKNLNNYIVLPEVISKEPLSPVVREGDDKWFNITKWTLNILLEAEERGITSKNIEHVKLPSFLNKESFYNAIKQVGNYGEIFDRNIGEQSPLKIERDLNKLWINGGLLYPLPF